MFVTHSVLRDLSHSRDNTTRAHKPVRYYRARRSYDFTGRLVII